MVLKPNEPDDRDPNPPVDLDSPAIQVVYGPDGRVRHIDHTNDLRAWIGSDAGPLNLADTYVTANIGIFTRGQPFELKLERPPPIGVAARKAAVRGGMGLPRTTSFDPGEGAVLRSAGSTETMGTTTVYYRQTWRGVPVWEAGLAVTISPHGPDLVRVTGAQSTLQMPPLAEGDPVNAPYAPQQISAAVLSDRLYLPADGQLTLQSDPRLWCYRYRTADRVQGVPSGLARPTGDTLAWQVPPLPLPRGTGRGAAERHTFVSEALVNVPSPDLPLRDQGLNWRVFVDAETGDVLYLRAGVAPCLETIFNLDPPPTCLDPGQARVPVGNIVPVPEGWVQIVNLAPPEEGTEAPSRGGPSSGDDDPVACTTAYANYHTVAMFRILQNLKLYDVFFPANTPPPVLTVDPLGMGGDVGAYVTGNGDWTRAESIIFGMAQQDTDNGLGAACDVNVALHEFCHVLLWARTGAPTLGFAHSAGDSLAAILSDPCSALLGEERYATFPWLMQQNRHLGSAVGWRYHGGTQRRCNASGEGWCWGGDKDVHDPGDPGGYLQEQLLSTTLFRVYEAIGGAPDNEQFVRERAARYLAYLIIRAISQLPPAESVPANLVDAFVTLLANADRDTLLNDNPDPETFPGGSITKVIYWSFTQQGLYQPGAGTGPLPELVTGPGQPKVDVCIGADDAYPRPNQGADALWNRQAPGLIRQHQAPVAGQPNHVYVEVRNRGWAEATGVVVRGYYQPDAAIVNWERAASWTALIPPAAGAGPDRIPAGGSTVYGPFEWTPAAADDWSLLISVSAEGDPSNIDPGLQSACATGPTPLTRLVPFDNNLALRQA